MCSEKKSKRLPAVAFFYASNISSSIKHNAHTADIKVSQFSLISLHKNIICLLRKINYKNFNYILHSQMIMILLRSTFLYCCKYKAIGFKYERATKKSDLVPIQSFQTQIIYTPALYWNSNKSTQKKETKFG